jgi:hypothetical protein
VWELVIALHLADFGSVGSENVVRNIDNEVSQNGLFMPLLPTFVEKILLFVQFFWIFAEKQAGNVIIVIGGGECLEGQKVLLDSLKLLLGRLPLVFVDFGCFFHLFALLEIGCWIELFKDIQDSIFTRPLDDFVGIFRVLREDGDVCRVFLRSAAAFATSLHLYERIIIIMPI